MTARLGLGAVGVVVGLYGGYLLLQRGVANLVATAIWLAAGVVVHDGLIGPAMVVAGAVFLLAVPTARRGVVAAGLVVLGTVTVTAIPVLTRFGARPDNLTLLDRDYTVGWLVFAGVVAAVTAAVAVRRGRTPGIVDDVVREPHDEEEA